MKTYILFALTFLKSLKNRVASLTIFGEFKAALFLFTGSVFVSALFVFFWRLISHLDSVALIGPALAGKFVSLVCLAVWWMVVFSSLNAAYGHFYFATDTYTLMSWPMTLSNVAGIKLMRVFRDSSMTALAAMAPLVAAFGLARGAPMTFYIQSFAGLVPFFFSAAAAGALVVILVSAFFPASKARRLVWVLLAASGSAIYVLVRLLEPERLVRPDALEFVVEYLSFLETPAAANLPSGVYYAILAKSSSGGFNAAPWAALLAVSAALFWAITVAARLFYAESLADKSDSSRSGRFSAAPARSLWREIISLDAKVFFREPQRWSQIMLVAGLFAVYLASVARIPADTFYLKVLVAFLNIGLVGFVASALSLRFVFAAFSEESGVWWALATAPLPTEKIVRFKFLSRAFAVAVLAAVLYISSAVILAAPWGVAVAGALFAGGLSLCAASAALYFGIRFPKKVFSSTAEIEGSSGGLFYVAASLFYVALNLAAAAEPFRAYYISSLASIVSSVSVGRLMSSAAAMFAVNAALAFLFYKKSVDAAARYE